METILVEKPTDADKAAILSGLLAYNAGRAPTQASDLAVVLREEGVTVGGLWGNCAYDWLMIELLFVPEPLRGRRLGTRLIEQAEKAARERGCIGAWLDTFSFQARGFYERLGYSLAGEIPDHPIGGARYLLTKRFS